MFPKNRRIPRKMFPLLKRAKTFKNNTFLLKVALAGSKGARFCFSVSKKTAKSAVVRNRLRRIGYRLLKGRLPDIKSDVLAVFSFRAVPKNSEDIAKSLESMLKESKLIK